MEKTDRHWPEGLIFNLTVIVLESSMNAIIGESNQLQLLQTLWAKVMTSVAGYAHWFKSDMNVM